jgi:hypothetical protein
LKSSSLSDMFKSDNQAIMEASNETALHG